MTAMVKFKFMAVRTRTAVYVVRARIAHWCRRRQHLLPTSGLTCQWHSELVFSSNVKLHI